VRTAFGQSPTTLRRLRGTVVPHDPRAGIVVHLPYRPPFDWSSLVQFFKSRATPGVESVDDETYRRTVEIGGVAGAIEVWHEPSQSRLSMRVFLPGCDRLMQVVQRTRRLFDLGADALHIGSYLGRDPRLAEMVLQRPGLRVPGSWDGFELAVLAILGQNLASPALAPSVARLVKTFGRPLRLPIPGLSHLFPQPEILVGANLETIAIPARQASTIVALAKTVSEGNLTFDSERSAAGAASQLYSLPGIGEDAAAYIAMRALGDPDAFSCTGFALRNALAVRRNPVSTEELARIFDGYRPWRAYAAMHYWTSIRQSARRARARSAARSSNARSIRRRSTVFRRPPLQS
jgi:AraC family transcriptional regulator of adaptative response / DNA-3-methyladenine glycosylase II